MLNERRQRTLVVLNLLSNAFKFIARGRIALTLDGGAGAAAGMLRLTVRDTGIGIAADELPRVFERFYCSGRSAGHRLDGSGIGLADDQSIARAVIAMAPGCA